MPQVGVSTFLVTNANGIVSVSVPSTAGFNVIFSADENQQIVLANVAPGGQAFFTVSQGFFYTIGVGGTSSYSLTQVTTGNKLYELSAAGATVTTTSTETVSATTTIPASLLQAGQTVRIRVQGIQTAVNGTDTCRFQVRIGPTTLTGQGVLDSTAVAGGVSYVFCGEFQLVVRAAPAAAAACVGAGVQNVLAATGAAMLDTYLGSTNFATNGALLVEATIKFSSANAGNSARVDIFEVILN